MTKAELTAVEFELAAKWYETPVRIPIPTDMKKILDRAIAAYMEQVGPTKPPYPEPSHWMRERAYALLSPQPTKSEKTSRGENE